MPCSWGYATVATLLALRCSAINNLNTTPPFTRSDGEWQRRSETLAAPPHARTGPTKNEFNGHAIPASRRIWWRMHTRIQRPLHICIQKLNDRHTHRDNKLHSHTLWPWIKTQKSDSCAIFILDNNHTSVSIFREMRTRELVFLFAPAWVAAWRKRKVWCWCCLAATNSWKSIRNYYVQIRSKCNYSIHFVFIIHI